jgi:hypothetical protein
MTDPIVRVRDVAFPRFQAPDLDVMQTFLETFGMHVLARDEDALFMRGTDGAVPVHATHRGPAAFLGLAFEATREDVDRLAHEFGEPVQCRAEPGGGVFVRLRDPDGRIVDVVAELERGASIAVRDHAPMNTGARRVRVDTLQRVAPGPSQVKRFGHAALKTTSLLALSAWYAETLGLVVSDDMELAPGATIGRFMRCDRGDDPADHHTLLVLETGEVRLGHCAWEVADLDDLMAGHDHLLAAEQRHYWGVGRHILGGQVFDYWKDPLGFTVEHWTDSDLLTASVPPATHGLEAAMSQWGPMPPADLDF